MQLNAYLFCYILFGIHWTSQIWGLVSLIKGNFSCDSQIIASLSLFLYYFLLEFSSGIYLSFSLYTNPYFTVCISYSLFFKFLFPFVLHLTPPSSSCLSSALVNCLVIPEWVSNLNSIVWNLSDFLNRNYFVQFVSLLLLLFLRSTYFLLNILNVLILWSVLNNSSTCILSGSVFTILLAGAPVLSSTMWSAFGSGFVSQNCFSA